MNLSRIPEYTKMSFEEVSNWFEKMSKLGLLFHPDDTPESIIKISNGEKLFSSLECKEINEIINNMFNNFGDSVYDAAYIVFKRNFHI